ncbi:MAG: hypothetical protein C4297_04470 [Gemmataceae bacterium]
MSHQEKPYRLRCIYLRCKSMLVYGEDFEQDPEYQAGNVDFWCTLTARNIGPDGEEVSLPACCNPERPCFREF